MSRTWIEINHHAFDHNIQQIKQHIGSAHIAVVVKSNAYGHGMQTVANLCQQNSNVNMLCTAFTSEAIELRQQGIAKPILVLSGIDTDVASLPLHRLILTVWDKETALGLNAVGKAHQLIVPVHVKVDTGLSRFGVLPHECISFMQWLNQLPFIQITGLYSHFIQSQKDTPLAQQQLDKFDQIMREQSFPNLTYHIANSSGMWRFHPHNTFNMVRVGLSAYGSWPSAFVQDQVHNRTLIPILLWKTRVLHIKSIPHGATVSYDATFTAPHAMRLGFLPVGYADGYDFRLANNAHVFIHNQLAPVVGKIAMNTITIDLTHIPDAHIGDEVTLMGPQEPITPATLAQAAGVPNVREITTKISPLIPRVIDHKTLAIVKNNKSLATHTFSQT